MSYETTQARWASHAARDAWKRHKLFCVTCGQAFRRRKYHEACAEGQVLLAERKEAEAELDRQKKLDRQPTPGQAPLFGPEEIPT